MSHLRHIPSFQSGLARCADECLYPTLWDRLTAWWDPGVGPTGTMLKNYSAHGAVFDGVFAGGTPPAWIVVDQLGWALRYAGNNDSSVTFPVDGRLQLGTGGYWTIAMWVRPRVASADGHLFSRLDTLGALGMRGAALYWTSQERVTIHADGTWNRAYSDAVFTDNEVWCHVAAVCRGSKVTFYRNGVDAGSGGNSTWTDHPTSTPRVGCQSNGWQEFLGDIGPMGLWNARALTPSEVMLLAKDYHAVLRLAG